MSYSQTYRTLFELHVLHEYYLNSGPDPFRDMNPEQQQLMFKNYAFNGFLRVIPTTQTRQVLNNQKLMVRSDQRGLQIVANIESTAPGNPANPLIPLADDLELHFLVKIGDPAFEIYTDLTLVKNELFWFSNIQPPGIVNFPYIPTSSAPEFISDGYRLDLAKSQEVAALLGITREEQIGLLGIITLRMHGDEDNITDGSDKVPATPVRFELEFANRSTIWKYYFQNSDYYAETTSPKPLTRNGYVEIDPGQLELGNKNPAIPPEEYDFDLTPYYYPAPDVRKTELVAGNLYSVIYI